ncbi:MAG: sensor histidine kinase, partial [Gemmatimonadota bacterium]
MPASPSEHVSAFQGLRPAPDPIEATAPVIELTARSPADARHALVAVSRGRVSDHVLDDLLIGTSEVVSNALRHGRP